MRVSRCIFGFMVAAAVGVSARAQTPAQPAAGSVLHVASVTADAGAIVHAESAAWNRVSAKTISLNRTPPLFDTDEPAAAEIPTAEVRVLRATGRLFVQLRWHDNTDDVADLQAVPDTPPEKRSVKMLTEAEDRFFDAAAVMVPANPGSAASPSLQMGDRADPVRIYYWNSVRGAMLMDAAGRGTTRQTGKSFPAEAVYKNAQWVLTLELADQPAGTPMAFAIWNGSQKDRDGRKYFSVWYTVE